MNLSAIIITRNEQQNILACIDCLKFAKEIIVVDNDSRDKTVSLAKSEGAKIYQISGLDFAYLRNIGKEKAKSSWVLYIDADERVTKELAAEIVNAVKTPKKYHAYNLIRQNYYLGSPWPKTEKVTRLMLKEALIGWQGSLHESPIVAGEIGILYSTLLHNTHRNLSSMVDKTNEWSEIEAQLRFASGHPKMAWWRFFRIMVTSFYDSFIKQGGWKVGTVGIIESIYQAFSGFVTYAKLWEKQNKLTVQNEHQKDH